MLQKLSIGDRVDVKLSEAFYGKATIKSFFFDFGRVYAKVVFAQCDKGVTVPIDALTREPKRKK